MTTVLIIIAFLVIFPLFWIAINYLTAKISGWATMAKYYRTDLKPEGYAKSMTSGTVGWARYNYVLNIVINEEGLYMSTISLFSIAHPPVFIPWEHIELRGKVDFLLIVRQRLSVFTPSGKRIAKVLLSRSIFEEAERVIPASIDGTH
ncbi:MAG: hypothetical protein R3E32_18410 [Chitinophagales bacterium]